ncbi:MAG: DegT/DnrJ/EryC1/StrS family aminotransferase [Candidatus Obscuribacterales bacterium]|nr:DegT/DnrJ/EryC1/StrS family aminotransferase [Candidatus Obscuribacterales bacterium]
MKVPFGDLKLHYQEYKEIFDQAVARVLASGYYILGPELQRFEDEFARYLDCKFTVGCASGTEAIYLALAALDIKPGDEVLVVAHTAVPTISAISMTGATPVFVDIDAQTMVIDVADLERKITERTKVIVPVHLYGLMADMDSIKKIADKHNLPVLEDVAQATGAKYKGLRAGSIGRFGAFSFYPSKNLGALGDGGAISCQTKEDYDRLLKLRNYGQSKRYHHDIVGINSRLDEIQAAILSAQIPFVDEWNDRRKEIAKRYTDGLKGIVQTPVEATDSDHVYHLYVIRHEQRNELQAFLETKGVGTLIHYPTPAHRQEAYRYLNYAAGSLPVTEAVANRILSLPLFPELTNEQVDFVIEAVREFVNANPNSASVEKQLATPVKAGTGRD